VTTPNPLSAEDPRRIASKRTKDFPKDHKKKIPPRPALPIPTAPTTAKLCPVIKINDLLLGAT